MKWLIGIFVALLIGSYLMLSAIAPKPTPMSEATMYKLLNEQRELKGLPPLTYDQTLERATEARAKGLCSVELSHDQFMSELEASGYNYTEAGENLAEGNYGSESIVQAWIESPTHYENIIRSDYTETGIAIVDCGHKTVTVQWFGK